MVAQGGLRPCTQEGQGSAAAEAGARLPKGGLQELRLTHEPDSHLSHSGLRVLEVRQALMQVLLSPALVLHQLEIGRGNGDVTQPPQLAGTVPPASTHHYQELSLSMGVGKGKTPWGSVLEDRNKGAAPGCGLGAAAGLGGGGGALGAGKLSPSLHPGACPYQALADPMCLLGLQEVLELLPLEELGSSKEGFPRGLHNSRSCEIAPWLAKETSWLCS